MLIELLFCDMCNCYNNMCHCYLQCSREGTYKTLGDVQKIEFQVYFRAKIGKVMEIKAKVPE